MAEFNLLSDKQFGFKNNYSTVYAACDVYTQLQAQKDQKLYTCLILLDLSKAFDAVDHNILMKKLHKFGLRESFGDLLKSYLNNRSQYVQIGEDIISTQLIKCGVPQESTTTQGDKCATAQRDKYTLDFCCFHFLLMTFHPLLIFTPDPMRIILPYLNLTKFIRP